MLGRVLVLLTTATGITLKNGDILKTGYDHFSFVEVVDQLTSEKLGFDVATLSGRVPHKDPMCLNHLPEKDSEYYRNYLETDSALLMPYDLCTLSEEQLHHYIALFIPGGYAALDEFRASPDIQKVIKHFHNHNKPIGVIGAGAAALIHSEIPWLFLNYKMTCLSEDIESELEAHLLHSELPYHIGYILEQLGARTSYTSPLETHIVEDGELITAQNKYSAYDFALQFSLKVKYMLKAFK